jgi:hypothetical protein
LTVTGRCRFLLAVCLVGLLVSARALAADAAGPQAGAKPRIRQHAWGRFRPGSWQAVRVTTETIDERGAVAAVSVSESRTTLEGVTDSGIRLKVEASVEVAGKRLDAPAQELTQGFYYGEMPGQQAQVIVVGQEPVTIEGKVIPCTVERLEVEGPTTRTIARSWSSDEQPPYMLKHEAVTTDLHSGAKVDETTVQVRVLSGPRRILKRLRPASELTMVRKDTRGKVVTRTWTCADVPGGVVAQESDEFNSSDRILRRSRMELIDYAVK